MVLHTHAQGTARRQSAPPRVVARRHAQSCMCARTAGGGARVAHREPRLPRLVAGDGGVRLRRPLAKFGERADGERRAALAWRAQDLAPPLERTQHDARVVLAQRRVADERDERCHGAGGADGAAQVVPPRDDLAQQQRPADAERRAGGRSAAARASERRVDSRERASRGVSMATAAASAN